ncbi:MAG: T9SS type A sorting domain-containing protein [Candidatus Cloacimonas sp.]|nr:T9SS type A sorting domain-containing protein [Candidatus Cloacimonas sp.]
MRKCFLAVLFGLLFVALGATESAPVRQAWNISWGKHYVKTSDACIIVAWEDTQYGDVDILAMKYNSSGQPQWTVPAPIVVKPGIQKIKHFVATSDNNFAITYMDEGFVSEGNFCTQKFNANGQRLWGETGVQVAQITYRSMKTYCVPTSTGGVFIVFSQSDTNNSISGYQLDSSGNSIWPADGLALFSQTSYYTLRNVLSDGAGGLLLNIYKEVSGSGVQSHLLRLSAAGTVIGTNPLVPVGSFPGDTYYLSQGIAGQFILYNIPADYPLHIDLQKIDLQGNLLLPAAVSIPLNSDLAATPQLASTADGGLVLAWIEPLSSTQAEVWVQKLDSAYNAVWPQGGKIVSSVDFNHKNLSLSVNENDAIWLTWLDSTTNQYSQSTVIAQYISPEGIVAWPESGKTISSLEQSKYDPLCLAFGDRAVFFWKDFSDTQNSLRQQVLSPSGTEYLAENGEIVNSHLAGIATIEEVFAMDNGYILFWRDYRHNGNSILYYQLLDFQMNPLLEENGRRLAQSTEGGVYLFGAQRLNGNRIAILYRAPNGDVDTYYVQVVDGSGNLLYPGMGTNVGEWFVHPCIGADGEDIYVSWTKEDYYDGATQFELRGQRIVDNQAMWEAGGKIIVPVETAIYPGYPQIQGGYFTWLRQDSQNNEQRYYTLRLDTNGEPETGWPAAGIPLIEGSPMETQFNLFSGIIDGNLAVVLGCSNDNYGSRIQKVSPEGVKLWGVSGKRLADPGVYATAMDVVFDNGIACLYQELHAADILVLQNFDADGNPHFGVTGTYVCTPGNSFLYPKLLKFQNGWYSVLWNTTFDGLWYNDDLYQRYISPTGLAAPAEKLLCNASFTQTKVKAAANWNSALVAWNDDRAGMLPDQYAYTGIYATHVYCDGSALSDPENSPGAIVLSYNNYPNPFNPSTTMSFLLKETGRLSLNIYNLKGQKVRTLANEELYFAGTNSLIWNGQDDNNHNLPSGVYLYSLQVDKEKHSGKMLMLK